MKSEPVGASAPATHITVRGLTKSFGGLPLYSGFDLDFPRSKITSIFGPNGCGKSTLINMIAGLIPVDAGEVLFSMASLVLFGRMKSNVGPGPASGIHICT